MKQSKNEENLENFNSSVNFNDGRYEVSFPFNEFHQELGDNYLTSKGRLRKLLTPLVTDVLLRFRSFNYVLVADIEEAFYQINSNPDHRNLVCF